MTVGVSVSREIVRLWLGAVQLMHPGTTPATIFFYRIAMCRVVLAGIEKQKKNLA